MSGGAPLFDLQKRMKSLSVGRELETVSGVILHAGQTENGEDKVYYAGDATGANGYVLECENDAGTQAIADSIFASLALRGFRYQPYEAGSAFIDPAAEIGDAVTADGTLSVIHSINTTHSRLMAADLSAPFDEEVNHEFVFESQTQREFKRETSRTRARLSIAEGSIEAKVDKAGDDGSTESFSWKLLSDSHSWYANNTLVMRVNKSGLRIEGEVYATSGEIGGAKIINGKLTIDGADITNINARNITAGYLRVERIENGSLTGSKVAPYTLTGGTDGNIANTTIADFNTTAGVQGGITGGIAYQGAASGTAAATNFHATYLHFSYIFINNRPYSLGLSGNQVIANPM